MSAATIFFAVLFYAATAILVAGLAYKIADYFRTPAPLKIPTTPAPTTTGGVVLRNAARSGAVREPVQSPTLWIWAFGILFHGALLLMLLRHLRYFTEPVWFWVGWVQPFGLYAGFAMVAGLAGLWGRRFVVERIRYISTPSDHLMLALLA
jgi:Nitrate reductase gamma subunit